jgi:hypothetical protein
MMDVLCKPRRTSDTAVSGGHISAADSGATCGGRTGGGGASGVADGDLALLAVEEGLLQVLSGIRVHTIARACMRLLGVFQ